ncbi:hypothetical protein [Ralstonia mannitolilytica]|uniref:hypothetical protein n=1 Tax=Ralstonia mannitolilytica TaxID=105219 RepID=UPI00292F4EFC|nr:hypothetical protein [Ralstonia mannitolilytica]
MAHRDAAAAGSGVVPALRSRAATGDLTGGSRSTIRHARHMLKTMVCDTSDITTAPSA